jgi:hypothetical protein
MRRALWVALAAALLAAAPARAEFGFVPSAAGFSAGAVEAGGEAATLAGSHPYQLKASVSFKTFGSGLADGEVRDLYLEFPPGLIENPSALPRCSAAALATPRSSPHEASRSGESCPDSTQIGIIGIHTQAVGGERWFGLFNLTPAPGAPARIGASPFGTPLTFAPRLRQASGSYASALLSSQISQLADVEGIDLELWGVPWSSAHDPQRGNCLNEAEPASPYGLCPVPFVEQTHTAQAYLALPTDCSSQLSFTALVDSWAAPGRFLPGGEPDPSDPAWKRAESTSPAPTACDGLTFLPGAAVSASTEAATSPSGLTVSLSPGQGGLTAPSGRAAPQPRTMILSLPEGITINPSVGAGLGACSEAQFTAETATSAPGEGCPNPSKIGGATVESPLVEGVLRGGLFIATPFQNPFGSAYALYFIARSAERGFLVKVAGKLSADPRSGQLTASFEDLPQLPYSNLRVEFREGQRAPLVTPPACGSYSARVATSPWANPAETIVRSSNLKIAAGANGRPCPTGAAPFAPKATAGTLNSQAAAATSFYLRLTRTDPEQEITSYSAALPPGLLGKIAGVPFCGDAAIEAAKSRSAAAELASPSCPPAAKIGHTYTGFGAGLAPAYAEGSFYLAGPYHGAPLSVVAINPAQLGPFDLGTIVIRSAIQVDPHTAQVTIDSSASDPIPHIFAGIPLRLRDIRVHVDRPGFMLNPSDCERSQITSTLTGSDVPFANPRSASAGATVPFQVSNCGALKFSPTLRLAVSGRPRRGSYPALRATYVPRAGDADIEDAAVTLPSSLFLAQAHIRDVCTRPQFAAEQCPADSQVGTAEAQTPLLSAPLQGPVYLRSSDHPLPDLVVSLRGGGGIRIVLEGRIDSHKSGIRASFEGLPDAPVSKFTMTIAGGPKKGVLQAAANLCAERQPATARLIGHAGLGLAAGPELAARCRHKPRKHHHRTAGRRHR